MSQLNTHSETASIQPITAHSNLADAKFSARSIHEWLSLLLSGFARPLEYWPSVQFTLALALAGLCAGGIGTWLCMATDVSGHDARMQALTELGAKLEHARLRVAGLAALRQRNQALGAARTPENVPDNEALLKLVSLAIDRSQVGLDVFEPGTPIQTDGIKEALLHVRVQGTYLQLLEFMNELARLPQPILPIEIRIRHAPTGDLSLDADLRIIAASAPPIKIDTLSMRNLGKLYDPFEYNKNESAFAGNQRVDSSSALADGSIVGTLQAEGKHAVLIRTGTSWRLFALGTSQSSTNGEVQ